MTGLGSGPFSLPKKCTAFRKDRRAWRLSMLFAGGAERKINYENIRTMEPVS